MEVTHQELDRQLPLAERITPDAQVAIELISARANQYEISLNGE
jgi:hypothetical protein